MYFKIYCSKIIFITYFVHLSTSAIPDNWVDPNEITSNYPDEWVDPHDMRPSKEYLKYTNNPSSLHNSFMKKKQNTNTDTSNNKLAEMYYKRTINMLLKSVHEDNNEIDTYSGYLYFKINTNDFKRLKNFADSINDENDFVKINGILEKILTKPSHQHIQEFLETWFHKFLNIAFSREGIITIILFSYFIIVYQMIKANFNLRYIFTFLFINIFIYDFIFTWIHLYQKTETEYMSNRLKYKSVPAECNPETLSSWHFLWNLIQKEDECHKYHQITYQDIFWKVSPGAVLTDIFARTIEQPASSIGSAFGNICAAIFDKFPWPLNIIIFPVAMIFFCLMTMITLSVAFNRNLHFNFLHLFSFSNSVATETTGDRLTDQNVERLLRIAENKQQNRIFIEEIQPKPSKSNKKLNIEGSKQLKITENTVEESEPEEIPSTNEENSDEINSRKTEQESSEETVIHKRDIGGGDFT